MGKISSSQQAVETSTTTPALPPQAAPLVEALGAMKALQGRLAAAEARAASHAHEIAPLTTALGDKLAAGGEGDDAALMEAERQHRRATAEAAGIQRLIEAQRAVVRSAMASCQTAQQAAAAHAKTVLEGRLKVWATRYLAVLAEASALHFATGEVHEATAVSAISIPTSLFDVPDPSLWLGVSGLQGDLAPVASDATQQIEAMGALLWQAQGVVGHG